MKRHHHERRRFPAPQSVNPAFAEALAGARRGSQSRRCKPDHKTLQLCRQVQRVLNLEFEARSAQPALSGLYVERVSPAPSAARLLVHIVVPPDRPVVDVLQAVETIAAALRAEVARAITRKRAPQLSYVPAAPETEVDDES